MRCLDNRCNELRVVGYIPAVLFELGMTVVVEK